MKLWWLAVCALVRFPLHAQSGDPADAVCPRPQPGATVEAPPELRSRNGTLEVTLHLRTAYDRHRVQRFCYRATMPDGRDVEAPTLRLRQGDTLLIHFANELSTDIHPQTAIPHAANPAGEAALGEAGRRAAKGVAGGRQNDADASAAHDASAPMGMLASGGLPSAQVPADAPCFALGMSATGSNLHFHGLDLAPVCHQDEVIHTLVRSGQSFDYRVQIPEDEPPGLYWYHPHAHGFSEAQVLGGASGALIVDAKADTKVHTKDVAGAAASANRNKPRQRLLILRDQLVTEATTAHHAGDKDLPNWDVSLNFVPVVYPQNAPARLDVQAGQSELWRVLNASADLTIDLEYVVDDVAQPLWLRSVDGAGLRNEDGIPRVERVTHLLLPPGARAEMLAATPDSARAKALLRTRAVDTGPDGENEPQRTIAVLAVRGDALAGRAEEAAHHPESTAGSTAARAAGSTVAHATAHTTAGKPAESTVLLQRRLYFSERSDHPGDREALTHFFLTVEGQMPQPYAMGQPANLRVHRGTSELWTVENRTRELHIFHMHQVHFVVEAIDGAPTHDGTLRDTVAVPYWSGSGAFPSVTVRLRFDPGRITGSFVYHCHILGHEDAGMMGVVDVLPEGIATHTVLNSVEMHANGIVSAKVEHDPAGVEPTGIVQFQVNGCVAYEAPLVHGEAVVAGMQRTPACDIRGPLRALYGGDRFFQPSFSAAAAAGAGPAAR